jgi:hypothetical protein
MLRCSYSPRFQETLHWLHEEGLVEYLSENEKHYLDDGKLVKALFSSQAECEYVFAWILGYVKSLVWSDYCPDDLVHFFPDLKMNEHSERFRRGVNLREVDDVIAACDLAYNLHWAVTETKLNSDPVPGKVEEYVIVERRRAFEWVLSDCDWDDVPLDT